MMDKLLYVLVRSLVAVLQALPLTWVARLGRAGGGIAFWLDARHRKVAIRNLTMCLKDKSADEIRALAKENFRRLGENYACAVKTASMSLEELLPHIEISGEERIVKHLKGNPPRSVVAAIGHFGNFELYAHYGLFLGNVQSAATYRGLRQPSLSRLMQSLREKSGCLFFERRSEGGALKAAMNQQPLLLGLMADQHPGRRGIQLPFLGQPCYHSTAAAIFALRYDCAITTGICYRIGLARWRIENGAEILTHENGKPRSVESITADVVRGLEVGVMRDPANWFWVHNRWKGLKVAPVSKDETQESEVIA